MPLCMATASVPGDLRAKLVAIAGAGFDGVELCDPDLAGHSGGPEDAALLAADLGLAIEILQPFDSFKGWLGSKGSEARDRRLDLLNRLGAKALLLGSSFRGRDRGGRESLVGDLGALAERADSHGVRLAYLALP